MKKVLSTVAILSLVAGAYFTLSAVNSYSPVTVAQAAGKSTYSGTLYVAGMGGHFSKADVSIDPNNLEEPITVNKIEMVDIGGAGYPTHDARIDASDRNTMYWSTYKLDTWKDKGAKGVYAYCTHPVLSGRAIENVQNSSMDELVVTDTIPLSEEAAACPGIRQVSVAGMLAETIRRIHHEESVSSLYMD